MSEPWPEPSERIADLIRQGLRLQMSHADDLFAEIDAVVLDAADPALIVDPSLVEGTRRSTRMNLARWVEANLARPGARVTPVTGGETASIARDIVRRGLDTTAIETYRAGQNLAWRRWMEIAFELTADPAELRELLDVTARSIFTFVDETIAAIAGEVRREQDRLTRGTHAQRFETVSLVLDGAPISPERASTQLNYELGRLHTAAVVFRDRSSKDHSLLERAAEELARAAGARRPLTIIASETSLWVWIPGAVALDHASVREVLQSLPDVRVALGATGSGIDGFRRSHLDALATQRLMYRSSRDTSFATFEDVSVVVLALADEDRAYEFIERALGDLATANGELRETLRTYLREGSSPTRAATDLFTHRNTVLKRISRAEELLGRQIAGNTLEIGLALELVYWIGTRP